MANLNVKKSKLKILTECAVMTALSSILSLIKLYELPHGGAVTAASMFPLILISYRNGFRIGLGASIVYGVIQQLFSLNTLSYVTTWESMLAVIVLDYILAFSAISLGGIFKSKKRSPIKSFILGSALVCFVRYLCHVLSGATVWAGISIPTKAAIIYSISYNATYMLPETIVLITVSAYMSSLFNFTSDIPKRIRYNNDSLILNIISSLGALSLVSGIIFDTVSILPKLQNSEAEFDITLLKSINYSPAIIVSTISVIFALFCFIFCKIYKNHRLKKQPTSN